VIPTIGVPMVASDAIRSMRASSSKLATPARSQVAAARSRLPKASTAPRLIAKTVLGYTFAVTIWTSLAVPLLPVEISSPAPRSSTR